MLQTMVQTGRAVAVLALVAAATATGAGAVHVAAAEPSFDDFKAAYRKSYTAQEHEARASVYADNVAYFEGHNARYGVRTASEC